MVSRLDLAFFTDVIFDKYDMDHFYVSHWNGGPSNLNNYKGDRRDYHLGEKFLDFWFFSNSEIMDKFALLYDKRKKYGLSPHLSSKQHVDTITDKIEYVFYRWFDHEMIRRKFLEAKE